MNTNEDNLDQGLESNENDLITNSQTATSATRTSPLKRIGLEDRTEEETMVPLSRELLLRVR